MKTPLLLLVWGLCSAVLFSSCRTAEHVARKGVHVAGHGASKAGHVVSRAGDSLQRHGN